MQDEVTGNLTGLKASEIKALERLYRRRVAPAEVVSVELAAQLAVESAALHRQVGVLIDRRGAIAHVMVGDASKIVLPDVGRMRGGQGRFRGLRLVHTHLRGEPLTRDDLTDLALLRLHPAAAGTGDASGVGPGRPGGGESRRPPRAGGAICSWAPCSPRAPPIGRGASCP